MRTVSSNHAASCCYPRVFLFFFRRLATMDTLAALGCSRCATGAGAPSRAQAQARLVAQHQNPAKGRSVLAQLSHGYLPYSVAFDEKLLVTSRGLGTGGRAASRHRGQQRARGEKSKEDEPAACLAQILKKNHYGQVFCGRLAVVNGLARADNTLCPPSSSLASRLLSSTSPAGSSPASSPATSVPRH